MDTRINHWVRIILDDVFGYDNFRNEIVWYYRSGGNTLKNSHLITTFFCFILNQIVIFTINKKKKVMCLE